MMPSPRFNSHAEQQAALGCAANLDPDKHPRRYAMQKAREKFTPFKRINQPSSDERSALVERARALSHLNINAAARALDISRSALNRLRYDYGLEFAPSPRPNASDRLKALAGDNPTLKELAKAAGVSYATAHRLCREYGIEPGVPNGQDPAGA